MVVRAHRDLVLLAVQHHGHHLVLGRSDLGIGRVGVRLHLGRLGRGSGKALAVDAAFGHTGSHQGRSGSVDHRLGTTDEHLVHALGRQQRVDQGLHLLGVDAALQQVHFLRLTRQDVDHGEAAGVAVLQILQGFVEHHAGHAAVAVHQGELGLGLLFQRGRRDRQDRGDAGAGRKTDAVQGTGLLDRETAFGRHHRQGLAGLDVLGGPVGEQAVDHRTDADLDLAVVGEAAARAADRVVAAHILAIDGGAHGQELTGFELEVSALALRNLESDGYRASRFRIDALDLQVMKTRNGHESLPISF